ncbi:trimethyllysine dioxygenase [Geosmithia morbida]|uniref:Trimethyllysine dioxygenase n=1 Tax=Geosmithia morbida TaxID=1094350 RepID=A0A9P5D283_9HYPO|nr:trimethyllysine dioxygenase [Geosmithia morbida]KAF4120560.1 trimethyllysine dioxygenase [Geosmithia morbida]
MSNVRPTPGSRARTSSSNLTRNAGSDGHLSVHPWSWLLSVVSRPSTDLTHAWTSGKRTWDASVSDHRPPDVSYDAVMATDGGRPAMAQLMQTLCEYGFAFVKDSPASPAATESLLSRIGPIRNTHYGGFYDFVPDLASADTAYTNLALAAHTDTTYFSDPAGLQSFHMLSHHPPPRKQQQQQKQQEEEEEEEDGGAPLGGQSLLVDGFRAAVEMRERWPEHFDTLRSLGIPWHASGNDDASITPDRRYPVIETLGGQLDAPIRRVRWNNDDRGVVPPDSADRWYAAARKWDSLLKDPANEFWFQLTPDRVLSEWELLSTTLVLIRDLADAPSPTMQYSTTGVFSMGGAPLKASGASAAATVRLVTCLDGRGARLTKQTAVNRDDYHSQWKISCHPRENVERYNLTQR